jgi:hypothetical protein
MKRGANSKRTNARAEGGFSILEAAIAAAVVAVMFGALLSGLTSSVRHVEFGREQNRATQIMVEKLDTIRMYKWDKIISGYVPTNFTDSFFPVGSLGGTNVTVAPGVTYAGAIAIRDSGLAESYEDDIKRVTVTLNWNSGGRPVQRQMTTYVSKYGLQKYIP